MIIIRGGLAGNVIVALLNWCYSTRGYLAVLAEKLRHVFIAARVSCVGAAIVARPKSG